MKELRSIRLHAAKGTFRYGPSKLLTYNSNTYANKQKNLQVIMNTCTKRVRCQIVQMR